MLINLERWSLCYYDVMTNTVKISKSLSYWLRHAPDAGQITLDSNGWTPVAAIRAALGRKGLPNSMEALLETVADNDKQRFELSDDHSQIRARQGHSVGVDAEWPEALPPEFLYHGTVDKFLGAIMAEGLKPMARHHVHLSPDVETAIKVGSRRGKPVILKVAAGRLSASGQVFHLSSNGVWLTAHIPPDAIAGT
jgi:putative RNA 2'-phosphotransferase